MKGAFMNLRSLSVILLAVLAVAAAAGCSKNKESALGISNDPGAVDNAAIQGDASAVADLVNNFDRSQFARVDRMAMPAVSTVLIKSKDAYNNANPSDDAAGMFVGEIVSSLETLHGALDDDLASLGLTPCATGDCVQQAAPFIVPDRIHVDVTKPSGFPNGRRLTDPCIDITLALALLDLKTHPVTTLIGVNPTANDRSFLPVFPYLAPPNAAGGR